MPMPPMSTAKAERLFEMIEAAMIAGHPPPGVYLGKHIRGAVRVAGGLLRSAAEVVTRKYYR